MAFQKKTLTGTIKQLSGRVFMNGNPLDQVALSVLTRLGNGQFCRVVSVNRKVNADGKPVAGRPETVWEIDQNLRTSLTVAEPAVTEPAVTEPAS